MEYPYIRIRCYKKSDMTALLDNTIPGKWFMSSYKIGTSPRLEGFDYRMLNFGIIVQDKAAAALLRQERFLGVRHRVKKMGPTARSLWL